ncbi:hypothetical protein PIB30_077599, partial [Stylosanthes scabra]|nr:hypothetical protein [Stylosanthes scabra]
LIAGDFNEVLAPEERSSGKGSDRGMADFKLGSVGMRESLRIKLPQMRRLGGWFKVIGVNER